MPRAVGWVTSGVKQVQQNSPGEIAGCQSQQPVSIMHELELRRNEVVGSVAFTGSRSVGSSASDRG
jgi:hypothetical protein